MCIQERRELGRLTTFEVNRNLPVYRWLYYKEAFSRNLVWLLLDEMCPGKGRVLDPFCGTGTTLLACKEKGLPSIGTDMNPIALTAARAEVMGYDLEELEKEGREIFSHKYTGAKGWEEMKRFFDKETLGRLLFYRSLAGEAGYKDFFLLALANAAYECSRVVRDGAVLRQTKKRFIPLEAAFKRNVRNMERDLRKLKLSTASARVMEADARKLPLKNNTMGAVITSPPYLGIEDYTKAYAIENFVVGGKIEKWLGKGGSAETYFADMLAVLKELRRVCNHGAKLALVMWDGFIGGKIIDTCEMMDKISEKAGLEIEKIWVVNRKPALVDRTKKVGSLRESIIFLRV